MRAEPVERNGRPDAHGRAGRVEHDRHRAKFTNLHRFNRHRTTACAGTRDARWDVGGVQIDRPDVGNVRASEVWRGARDGLATIKELEVTAKGFVGLARLPSKDARVKRTDHLGVRRRDVDPARRSNRKLCIRYHCQLHFLVASLHHHHPTVARGATYAARTSSKGRLRECRRCVALIVGRGDDAVTSRATSPPLRARSRPTIASTPAR